jgi:hypothetical protein
MKIATLARKLEEQINQKMEQIVSISNQVKKLISNKAPNHEIEQLYLDMALILVELEPVELLIRAQNPRLNQLFDGLHELYREKINLLHKGKKCKSR